MAAENDSTADTTHAIPVNPVDTNALNTCCEAIEEDIPLNPVETCRLNISLAEILPCIPVKVDEMESDWVTFPRMFADIPENELLTFVVYVSTPTNVRDIPAKPELRVPNKLSGTTLFVTFQLPVLIKLLSM
jgi:hypothetical protein